MTTKITATPPEVVMLSTESVIPYAQNAKKHTPNQVASVARSIEQFGFNQPIAVDPDLCLVAGHGRLLAAKKLGLKSVPAIILQIDNERANAYRLADNKLNESKWDMDLVLEELKDIKLAGLDIELTGFSIDLLDLGGDVLEDEYDTPASSSEPASGVGDIYKLGEHRLMCGDATNQSHVALLMGGELAAMVFTDPPYNTGMKPDAGRSRLSHMFDDSYTDNEWMELIEAFCAAYNSSTQDDATLYICLDWRRSHELVPAIKKYFKFSNLIVWDKVVHGLGSDYQYTHEFIHVAKKGKPTINSHVGDREYQDVWRIQRKMSKTDEHATQKPIELCARAISHASVSGDLVLDLFGGSGSTLISAEQMGRRCNMMELDPSYIDVIIRRWETLTGLRAEKIN